MERLGPDPNDFGTLAAALAANLREDRHVVLIDGEDNQRRLSFVRLRQHALGELGALQRRGVAAGDAVLLYVADNERFLTMFWACVLGGIVPVPLAAGASDEHRRKLFRVFGMFDRAWVFTDAPALERLAAFAQAQGLGDALVRVQSRALPVGGLDVLGADGRTIAREADDVAFIQFSSGSTSEPKGVVLTHRNLTANLASIRTAARFTDRDVALSWMPLSHDMGLIGFHLHMLAYGVTHAIMRTDLFARRPLLWLAKATELRATVLCSPNFGYEHYLRQYQQKRPQGLDLSPVRLVFNGAEPISAELCRRFTRTMAPHGLAANSMFPVYGLAEASLAVTFPRPGSPLEALHVDRNALRVGEPVRRVAPEDPSAVELVELGRPVPRTEVRIVDERGVALGKDVVGHVHMRGDNVTAGYWRQDAATAAARSADGWFDTGDLGFLDGAELVIAGRAKDIIFVNGQNWYPHDLEAIAAGVPGVEINKVVAAGVRNEQAGTEDVALFVLHRGSPDGFAPVARELQKAVGQQTGLEVAHVVPVTRIPKTTSGKLQRHMLARAFEAGEFADAVRVLGPLLAEPAASSPAAGAAAVGTGVRLKDICDRLIPDKRVSMQTNLFEINLNSLTLARIHEAIDREFPGRLEVTDLFDYPTLDDLARFLDARPA